MSYFGGGGGFESSPTCLVGNAVSEGFLILGFFFGPLFPCAYYFSLRDSLGGRSLGLSLAWPLGMLRIRGVIFPFPCSLPCSGTFSIGTIWSIRASIIFFLI